MQILLVTVQLMHLLHGNKDKDKKNTQKNLQYLATDGEETEPSMEESLWWLPPLFEKFPCKYTGSSISEEMTD